MTEREWLYDLKREVEDRIDGLELMQPEVQPPAPIDRPRLAVVVGHTARSPGAYSKALGVNEYAWNTGLANMMKDVNADLTVGIFTRDQGGIAGAYKRVKEWGADLIMELHFNAASAQATGTETIYLPPNQRWASIVQKHMVKAMGLRDRGAKGPWNGRGETSLKSGAGKPVVIIEPFFGSNEDDSLKAASNKSELAMALVSAAVEFLEGE